MEKEEHFEAIMESSDSNRLQKVIDAVQKLQGEQLLEWYNAVHLLAENGYALDRLDSPLATMLKARLIRDPARLDEIFSRKTLSNNIKESLEKFWEKHFVQKQNEKPETLKKIGAAKLLSIHDKSLNEFKLNVSSSEHQAPTHQPYTGATTQHYDHGNVSPIVANSSYRERRGVRRGVKKPFDVTSEETQLNLARYEIQMWPEVIQRWKDTTMRRYTERNFSHTAEQMVSYMETSLGPMARNLWDAFKREKPEDYASFIAKGSDPCNFMNIVGQVLTGVDLNMGTTIVQERALRNLAQIQLHQYPDITRFLNKYIKYASQSQKCFDTEVIDKLFMKLPGALGNRLQEAYEKWKLENEGKSTINVVAAASFLMRELEDIRREVSISEEVKGFYKVFTRNLPSGIY